MSLTINRLPSRGLVAHLVLLLAMTPSSMLFAASLESAPVNWRSLELQDSGLTASVTTRIELRELPATEVQPALLDAPGAISPREAGTRIEELVVASSIRWLLGAGFETGTRLWFNADNGLPLQLIRLRQGSKPSLKRYRFGSHQVYRERRQPADKAQTEQPSGHWSDVSESFYPLAGAEAGCSTILESSQLLYLLSRPERIFSGQAEELCVFDRQRVYRVEIRDLEREQVKIDYRQLAAGQETRVNRTLDAIHVVLTSRPLDGAEEYVQPFSFLGLSGEIHLLLSDPGRIPLQVRGQVSGFGMIDLELMQLTR